VEGYPDRTLRTTGRLAGRTQQHLDPDPDQLRASPL